MASKKRPAESKFHKVEVPIVFTSKDMLQPNWQETKELMLINATHCARVLIQEIEAKYIHLYKEV